LESLPNGHRGGTKRVQRTLHKGDVGDRWHNPAATTFSTTTCSVVATGHPLTHPRFWCGCVGRCSDSYSMQAMKQSQPHGMMCNVAQSGAA
jgi:hypothetical protein